MCCCLWSPGLAPGLQSLLPCECEQQMSFSFAISELLPRPSLFLFHQSIRIGFVPATAHLNHMNFLLPRSTWDWTSGSMVRFYPSL